MAKKITLRVKTDEGWKTLAVEDYIMKLRNGYFEFNYRKDGAWFTRKVYEFEQVQ